MTAQETEPLRHLPPVRCEPWCTDGDGHTDEAFPGDQSCWGFDTYVELSLQEPVLDADGFYPAQVGAQPYRKGEGARPFVFVHLEAITLKHAVRGNVLDDSLRLTTAEARALAAALLASADA